MAPEKPALPIEVKVPMVAIVVSVSFSGRDHRDLDSGRQTGGDRPAPTGSPLRVRNGVVLGAGTTVKGSQGEAFLSRAE